MRLGIRSLAVASTCLALCATAGLAAPGADARGVARHSLKPLKVSIHFAKHRYAPGTKAHVTIKLKNTGSTKLTRITAACDRVGDPDELVNKGRSWGALAYNRSGVTLAAHSTRTFHVTAKVPSAAQRFGHVVLACDFGYRGVDAGYRPQAYDSARVPGQSGALEGDVLSSGPGADTPAGLANVRIVLADPAACPVMTRTATTDAAGHFRIASAPAGSPYTLYLFPPKGWKIEGGNSTAAMVIGKDTANFSFQAEHGSARTPAVPTKCR